VAVDGSGPCRAALDQGIRLARDERSRLRLVHVIDELAAGIERPGSLGAFWEAARKAGTRILEDARARALRSGIEPRTKLIEVRTLGTLMRHVADAIVADAKRSRADLIVIGTHGRRGLSKLLLGSVADGVVRTSPIPVLLVRSAARKARRRRS
jgi:nucleotide-binding universal stress UspA family protein